MDEQQQQQFNQYLRTLMDGIRRGLYSIPRSCMEKEKLETMMFCIREIENPEYFGKEQDLMMKALEHCRLNGFPEITYSEGLYLQWTDPQLKSNLEEYIVLLREYDKYATATTDTTGGASSDEQGDSGGQQQRRRSPSPILKTEDATQESIVHEALGNSTTTTTIIIKDPSDEPNGSCKESHGPTKGRSSRQRRRREV